MPVIKHSHDDKQHILRNKMVASYTNTPAPFSESAEQNPYLHLATSNNTRKAYRCDVSHFERWGGKLPATPEIVVTYLQTFAKQLNVRTLSRRLTALKQWHRYQGFTDPTEYPLVRKTLIGITHAHGKPKEKAPPLLPEQLLQIVTYLKEEDTLIAYRDNALLQVGFFGAFRRSELVHIHYEDLNRCEQGIEIMIPRSKTDQEGEGHVCAIPYGNKQLCPVTALEIWLEKSRITEGAIFRGVNRWGELNAQPLTPLALNQILKKRAGESGIPHPEQLSSYSLRRGLATSASREGASLKAIMRQGRWQQVSTVLGYIEEGQRFHDNAANVILQKNEN